MGLKTKATSSRRKTSTFSFACDRKTKACRSRWHSYLNKIIFGFIVLFSLGYVAGINHLSITGFVLHDLKMKKAEINKQNDNFELVIMDLESYNTISKKANEMAMVTVDKIDYLSVGDDTVAKK